MRDLDGLRLSLLLSLLWKDSASEKESESEDSDSRSRSAFLAAFTSVRKTDLTLINRLQLMRIKTSITRNFI